VPDVRTDPEHGRWLVSGCAFAIALPLFVGGVALLREGLLGLHRHVSNGVAFTVIGLLLTLISAGIVFGAFATSRRLATRSHRRVQYAMQPWLWREDWESRRVVERNPHLDVVLWLFGIAWCAIALPVALAVYRLMFARPLLAMVMILFPAAGVMILICAAYVSLRSWKFGRSVCAIDRLPIAIGRSFHGDVEHHGSQRSESGYDVVLTSVRRIRTQSGRGQSWTEEVLWQSQQHIPAALAAPTPDGMRVPFDFEIPPDAASTDQRDMSNQTLWRLQVTAELPGIDYKALFELPVFETEGQDAEEVAAYHMRHRHAAARRGLSPESHITTTPLPSGDFEFRVAPAADYGAFVTMLLFLAIWAGAIALMLRLGAPWFFAGIFVLFGLFFVTMIIDLMAGRSIIVAGKSGLRARREWFGKGVDVNLTRESIESIQAKPGAYSGSKTWFDVEARLANGLKRLLARYVPSSADAETLAAKVWVAMEKDHH